MCHMLPFCLCSHVLVAALCVPMHKWSRTKDSPRAWVVRACHATGRKKTSKVLLEKTLPIFKTVFPNPHAKA